MVEQRKRSFEQRFLLALRALGLLTQEQYGKASSIIQEGHSLWEAIQKQGVTRKKYIEVLSDKLQITVVDITRPHREKRLLRVIPIPREVALELGVLLFGAAKNMSELWVAMEDPWNEDTLQRLQTLTGKRIKPCMSLQENLRVLIEKRYAQAGL